MSIREKRDSEKRDYYEEQSFVVASVTPGELWGFNLDHGFLEAILRGFRSGFLRDTEYKQLTQCGTLDDFKLCFNDTDYVGVLENVAGNLTTENVVERCYAKFVDEFMYLRSQATGSLATFLNLMQYDYMISNVMFLITGLVNGNEGKELITKINPLGTFPRISSILTFENSDEGFLDLYRTVLIDMPIGKYFEQYFVSKMSRDHQDASMSHIKDMLDENDLTIIHESVQKLWLEDFYRYCRRLGGMTAEVMLPLLEFRADLRAVNIMMNSFGTSLNEPQNQQTRDELFCSFGELYPVGIESFKHVSNEDQLQQVLTKFHTMRLMLERAKSLAQDANEESWIGCMNDVLTEEECRLNEFAFEMQSHFGCFYAFERLKLQEKKNIYWIAECIQQNMKQEINKFIAPFKKRGVDDR